MTKRGTPGLILLRDTFTDSGGLFASSDSEALGISKDADRRLRKRGRVSRPHHGVRMLGEPTDLLDRVRAASLVLPPGAAIGRRTAAELMGVDPRLPAERHQELDIDCLVPTGTTPLRRDGIRSYSTDLQTSEINHETGFPVTTPDRTLADLLRWLPPHMALAVADRMARRDLVDPDVVESILDRWDGHRYVAQARRLLDHIEPKSESYGESWLRLRLLDAGFPRPAAQIPIMENGVEVYRLDLGWEEQRIAVEYDGEEFHSSRKQRTRDALRRERLFKRHHWTGIGVGKAYVLGPTMDLELGVGEMLGIQPNIRHRTW